ncbi:hypothetical protein [Sphingobium lignivorans]|uniref:Uncharacterized protein n=1 Tax=Sphingobium lignivorans TaxID=2735886 RepID=A0ABR6NJH0_9SPHN|nr:hypothetical protein [Sphingobium lignivorans]MBB5987425.1 hypothetical protein [Sphingobium lignivorans]
MPTITGFSRPVGCALIRGGAVGQHAVPGNLRPGDTLLSVEHISDGTPPTRVDRTAEFTVSASKAGTIVNTTTNTTGGWLHVLWAKAE